MIKNADKRRAGERLLPLSGAHVRTSHLNFTERKT